MPDKQIALVVDDKDSWLNIFEEVLRSKFKVEKAKTLREAESIVQQLGQHIQLAIVDIRLQGESDRSGLDVLQMLKTYGINSIATSAYYDDETKVVRDAFILGRAKDFWFKNKIETAKLRGLVDEILKEASFPNENLVLFRTYFIGLVGLPIAIFALLTLVVTLVPQSLIITVLAAGTSLIVLLIVAFARFTNKITGDQFAEIVKSLLKKN